MLKTVRMNRYQAFTCAAAGLAMLLGLAAVGCGKSQKTIVVGSMSSTEQVVLGEIVAQHLEHRLGRKVDRRLDLGGTTLAYQAFQSGEISLYAEYAGSIVTQILKEQPGDDASLIFARAQGEMKRTAQAELLNPLGLDNSFVVVIRADDPRAAKVSTLSEAAAVKDGWILGATREFQQLSDGMPMLTQYKLPMKAAPRSMDGGQLFKALEDGMVTMIVAHATDGVLTQKTWKVLSDDRHVFVPKQASLLVQGSMLAAQPDVRPVLDELSGKITTAKMRELDAQVDLDQQQPKDVAAAFLAQSGL
ncbi:MAG TPA: glycine betaine ABC transporter substrate-binding protein [Bryobacteraceae bacterium]|nr:glycine betaine ABC transporter substrate-binding protein [Bryobacteraceae bacterium]